MTRVLTIILFYVFLASARVHGARGEDRQAAAREAGAAWAATEAARLAKLLRESTQRMLADVEDDEDEDALEDAFGREGAKIIVSDVVTIGQHNGGEWAILAGPGIDVDDLWHTAADEGVCEICESLDGKGRAEWMEAAPQGPPAHPRCRCRVEYAVGHDAVI